MKSTCPSCGGDTSGVTVKKRLFAHFVVRVVCCPHCRLRKTYLTSRKFVDGKPACGFEDSLENVIKRR
jgi:hypothetical protein